MQRLLPYFISEYSTKVHAAVRHLNPLAGAGAGGAWAQEFADNKADFADWDSIYARNAEAGVSAGAAVGDGEYVFSEHNPFLGDAAAFDKGKDLFKRGLLSEAALALEAEVGFLASCPSAVQLCLTGNNCTRTS